MTVESIVQLAERSAPVLFHLAFLIVVLGIVQASAVTADIMDPILVGVLDYQYQLFVIRTTTIKDTDIQTIIGRTEVRYLLGSRSTCSPMLVSSEVFEPGFCGSPSRRRRTIQTHHFLGTDVWFPSVLWTFHWYTVVLGFGISTFQGHEIVVVGRLIRAILCGLT